MKAIKEDGVVRITLQKQSNIDMSFCNFFHPRALATNQDLQPEKAEKVGYSSSSSKANLKKDQAIPP